MTSEADLSIAHEAGLADILGEPLLSDLHALLWLPPFLNGRERDHGWSCRDHAAVLAALLEHRGHTVDLVHGRCMWVLGPDGDLPPVGLGMDWDSDKPAHTWLRVEGYGDLDVSPRLTRELPWRGLDVTGVLGGQIEPAGRAHLVTVDSHLDYARELGAATFREGVATVVYWEQRHERFDAAGLGQPAALLDSPLAHKLVRDHGDAIYLKLVTHLQGLAAGMRSPLARVSRNKAWRLISRLEPAA